MERQRELSLPRSSKLSISTPDTGAISMSQGALALSIIVLIGIIIIAIFLGLLYQKVDNLPPNVLSNTQ